jgi:hypothetical protein
MSSGGNQFSGFKYSGGKNRMAGDYLKDFSEKYTDKTDFTKTQAKDYRGEEGNKNEVASFLGNSADTSSSGKSQGGMTDAEFAMQPTNPLLITNPARDSAHMAMAAKQNKAPAAPAQKAPVKQWENTEGRDFTHYTNGRNTGEAAWKEDMDRANQFSSRFLSPGEVSRIQAIMRPDYMENVVKGRSKNGSMDALYDYSKNSADRSEAYRQGVITNGLAKVRADPSYTGPGEFGFKNQ